DGAGADPNYSLAKVRRSFDGSTAEEVLQFQSRSRTGTLLLRAAPPPGIPSDRVDVRLALVRNGQLVGGSPASFPGLPDLSLRVEPGKYQAWAFGNGFVAGPIPAVVEEGESESLAIEAWRPSAVIRGRVVGPTGEPVERVAVHLALGPGRGGEAAEPLILEWTDAEGQFVLPGLPALPGLTLRALAPGRSSRILPLAVHPPPSEPLELVLEANR
ncbi:MAG TPA: carboxypeptidase-like regulatory domain-containing protein, partial [Planctomycetota bacterium]|nr:carboxypeptidase-like regulatory domain-containing protein [Planctomycetota bacterium]